MGFPNNRKKASVFLLALFFLFACRNTLSQVSSAVERDPYYVSDYERFAKSNIIPLSVDADGSDSQIKTVTLTDGIEIDKAYLSFVCAGFKLSDDGYRLPAYEISVKSDAINTDMQERNSVSGNINLPLTFNHHVPIVRHISQESGNYADISSDSEVFPSFSDKVGDVRDFKVSSTSIKKYSNIKAELKRKIVKNTKNGQKTLMIYTQTQPVLQSTELLPSDKDLDLYEKFFFAEDGIYNTLIKYFGNDNGLFTNQNNDIIDLSNQNGFAILFCDIDEQGPEFQEGFVHGYFDPTDLYLRSENANSNQLPLIYIHAWHECGDDIASGLLTLAHEYQHFIHCQYLGELVKGSRKDGDYKNDVFINELFSICCEIIFSKKIQDFLIQNGISNPKVEDPFCVLLSKNANKGFIDSSLENKQFLSKGKGKYALESFGGNVLNFNNTIVDYGRASAFAQYLLANYDCSNLFKSYLNKPSLTDRTRFDILLSCLDDKLSFHDFLYDYTIAALFSSFSGMKDHHSFNNRDFFRKDGFVFPSVDLNVYYQQGYDTPGFQDSVKSDTTQKKIYPNTVQIYNLPELKGKTLKKGDSFNIEFTNYTQTKYYDMVLVIIPKPKESTEQKDNIS